LLNIFFNHGVFLSLISFPTMFPLLELKILFLFKSIKKYIHHIKYTILMFVNNKKFTLHCI